MSVREVNSEEQLENILNEQENPVVIGFFGDFSGVSKKAEEEFARFAEEADVLRVDVGKVKGIHKRYGVDSVPTVLQVKGNRVINQLKGFQTADYYARAFLKSNGSSAGGKDGKPQAPPVTVWTSSSCPWCTRVKTYLRQNHVSFTEVNISNDPSAADALRSRTGQTGVPQLSIGGRYVVGFDKPKIDRYLGLEQ